ncbi:hypothetical protein Plim_1606 [Planctopirus limnophila DSM 3776]|uniref:Uncharacterized protein n=1 Tax=Planctopirus limnophila (strain ATCC 43296 / DSM 3776 / IFAM 1008 / Mu 290) TaxID=521674 RepID=D5SWT9_PLAL2|nr:hypothetical protein [Planctopirus limnophila]ADG67439.1 hypothetical protein Plim_1606 [Planctopirus limnophila DSM 3776]
MIEDEVLEIVNSGADGVDGLTRLVDQFRESRDVEELLRLLLSDNDDLVNIGTLITSEISAERYNTVAFIRRLRELSHHALPSVQTYAFRSLFPFDNPTKQESPIG